jgi:septin 7
MVVGESGLGKSTLINSMFLTNIYNAESKNLPKLDQTMKIESQKVMLNEKSVNLTLTVVDTPGNLIFLSNFIRF